MDVLLQQLIETLNKTAPVVWEIAVRQVYVNAWVSVFWAVMLVILIFVANVLFKKNYSGAGDAVLVRALSFLLGALALFLLTDAFMKFANPQYYAIDLILHGIN